MLISKISWIPDQENEYRPAYFIHFKQKDYQEI